MARQRKWMSGLLLSGGLALALSGCGSSSGGASNEPAGNGGTDAGEGAKLNVAATIYPMAEFARQVGGSRVNVVPLVPTGVEPHDWEPSAKDMAAISDADVFVYNGIVESWAEQAIGSAANPDRVDVEASRGLADLEGSVDDPHPGEESEGDPNHADEQGDEHAEAQAKDPHVWLDPVLAQQEVRAIQKALEQADPDYKDHYAKNADAYIAKLEELHQQFVSQLETSKRKDFVTSHAAFTYLAERYGLKQVPISGLSPEQEPSPEQMAQVIEFVREHQVKTIFFETLIDSKLADTIAAETQAGTDVLNPLEGLTKEQADQGEDYISVMTSNLNALVKALNG
ncbi:zinc ABC transporter substrate-binding protein [Paenibacillus albicereus]|uniref:Zinc ABC transporter substrate-binding protein n=1 Tax=Paenibacillus albicereus TaxID=2726185 RepID=A0A6H2GX08_9BACL|nr:metal ABC transporter substrate-binding protein [Paenibacillus albicereus]QJC51963.1 zinc ABC transporter substrate-binding protein [Paenibacillus albicereus]